jgi:hypothetical protein
MLLAPGGFLRVARKYVSAINRQKISLRNILPAIQLIPSSGQGPNAVLNFS